MTLRLNGSTSGYVEIDAPAVAGDNRLTLPSTPNGSLVALDSNGRLGIGTSSPSSLLHIAGSSPALSLIPSGATNAKFIFDNSLTFSGSSGSNDRLHISFDGKVGIGTATPAVKLAVYDSSLPKLHLQNGTSGVTDGDGLQLALSSSDAFIWNFENGDVRLATNNIERIRIDAAGRFWHISPTGYNYYLSKSDAGNTYVAHYISSAEGSGFTYSIFYRDDTNTGSISYNGTGIVFNNTSDYRLKENVLPINDGIDRVKQLKPSRFNFKAETGFDPDVIDGFIAHEVKDVVPNAVTGKKDAVNDDGSIKPQQLDHSKLVPVLTAALKEAIAKIETLEASNADLETRLAALEVTP